MLQKNHIYHLDCFEFLKQVEKNSVNLAIIDPPYNMKKADWDSFKSQDDFLSFTYQWIGALLPTLQENGSLYIFNTPFNCAYILQYLISHKMIFQNWITWDKRDGLGSAKRKYSNGQESILFFTKSKNHIFNYNDVRVPYQSSERIAHAQKKGILKNGKRWFPNPNGRFCGEVWHMSSQRHKEKINGKTQKMKHLTPKPYDMIERMVKASSKKGDLVLDCFVGSGTTAVVAKDLGRNFLCADSNKDYILSAQERIKDTKEVLQYVNH